MYMDVTLDDFARGLEGDFSFQACVFLYDYLTYEEQDTGEQIEFDAVAIRCEFAEYDSWQECLADYSATIEDEEIKTADEAEDLLVQYTQVVCCNDDLCIIAQF